MRISQIYAPLEKMTCFVFLSVLFTGTFALTNVEEVDSRERLFLDSLGLSTRPTAAGASRRVPSMLWRMFQRSKGDEVQESESCMVSEYGVRGNIIRYVQDQGKTFWPINQDS